MGDPLIATPVVRIVEWAAAAGRRVDTGPADGWPLPAGGAHVVALVDYPDGLLYRAAADGLWAGAFGWMYRVDDANDGVCCIQVRTDWLQVDPGPFAPYEEGDAVPGAEEISKSTWTAEGVIPSEDERPLTPGQALGAAAYDARQAVKSANGAMAAAEQAGGEAKDGRLAIIELTDHLAAVNRALGVLQEQLLKRLDANDQAVENVAGQLRALDARFPDQTEQPDEPDEPPVETPAKAGTRKAPSK